MTSKKDQESVNKNQEKKKVEKNKIEELKRRKEEIDLYLKEGLELESRRGRKIKVPPLSGKREKKALSSLIAFIVGDPEVVKLFNPDGGFQMDVSLMIKLLSSSSGDNAFECLEEITAILLEKPSKWVDDNLLLGEMIKVVRPFFVLEGDQLAEMREETNPPPQKNNEKSPSGK